MGICPPPEGGRHRATPESDGSIRKCEFTAFKKVKLDLSVKEEEFARQSLATRVIPSPKLLIKVPRTINENGEFPTRLVIPTTNFTETLSNIGYLGIKRCLDKGKVNHSRNSIVQASNLKETLEEMGLKKEEVTIVLVDVINMYPSIKPTTIKRQ